MPKTPQQRAAFDEMYRHDVEPILARIEKTLSTKSVPQLFEMLAGIEAMLPDNKGGKYAAFIPADASWDVIYLVSRDGNRLIFKELSKRLPSERKVFEEHKRNRDIRYDRMIFTGSGGNSPSIRSLCATLLQTGNYE